MFVSLSIWNVQFKTFFYFLKNILFLFLVSLISHPRTFCTPWKEGWDKKFILLFGEGQLIIVQFVKATLGPWSWSLLSVEMMQQQQKFITFSWVVTSCLITRPFRRRGDKLDNSGHYFRSQAERVCRWCGTIFLWATQHLQQKMWVRCLQKSVLLAFQNLLTLSCKPIRCKFWALWPNFYICCVMSRPHGSTVHYDAIQTVQNLRFSISHILY